DEDVHGPPRGRRYERRPVFALDDGPPSIGVLRRQYVTEHVTAVLVAVGASDREHPFGAGRDARIRIDLTVRVMQRHADLLAPVLEREDLLDAVLCRQFGRSIGERFQHGAHATRTEDRKSTRLNSSHVKISYAVF